MMTAWDEYLDAARRLDTARREATEATTAQATVARAAGQELATLKQRLALQQARLTGLATQTRMSVPSLAPDQPVPDPPDPTAAGALIRAALADVDNADAALSEVDTGTVHRGPWPGLPQTTRNVLVYGAVALVVLITQLVLYSVANGPAAEVGAAVCDAALPALGYGVSWASVGLLYGKVDRTPVLGAVISATPVFLICGWIAVTTLLR